MVETKTIDRPFPGGGAELTLAAMPDYSRENIAEKTYRFVRRLMRNPECRELIQKRAEEIRASGLYE